MKHKLFTCLLLGATLLGCQSTPTISASQACQPLTYECHKTLKPNPLSAVVGKPLTKALALKQAGKVTEAINIMEKVDAKSNYAIAQKHFWLANLKSEKNLFASAKQDFELALKGAYLSPDKHSHMMYLQLETLFETGDYQQVKEKSRTYLNYLEQDYHIDVFARLAFIAEQEGDTATYEKLLDQINSHGKANKAIKRLEYYRKMYAAAKADPKLSSSASTDNQTPSKYPVAIYRVAPKYPIDAASNNQEGWVKMRYDINSQGEPVNIEVLESEPSLVFDNAGIQALKNWRYKVSLDENGQVKNGQGLTLQLDWTLN